MGTVKPVPKMDLDALVEEGHHPKFFVKAVPSSLKAMENIAKCRAKAPQIFARFDRDIWSYASNPDNVQSEKMVSAKNKAIQMISNILPSFNSSTLHFCGSTKNGCGLKDADVDFCWAIPQKVEIESDVPYPMDVQGYFSPGVYLDYAKVKIVENLQDYLEGDTKIVRARVPILNFRMNVDDQHLDCDMNINNTAGIHNTLLVAHYAKIDSRLPALARLLKRWGKNAEIIHSYSGFLNSYTMVLMIIHFFQCGVSPPILPNLNALRPDLFDGNLDLRELEKAYDYDLGIEMEPNDTPIGDLLIGFLRYYGFFCYDHDGIYLRMGCIDEKPKTKDQFFLEEVYDRYTVPKNLTADKMKFLKTVFLDAYTLSFQAPVLKSLLENKKAFMSGIGDRRFDLKR